ncbi:MAG: YceI family protein [Deltaproteobacteria bacterium]|nr:YceI family protein [Deltaproteobacteria bacterium]
MNRKLLLLNALFILDPHASAVQFHAVAALHAFEAKVPDLKGEASVDNGLASAHGRLTMQVRTIDTNVSLRNTEMLKLLEPDKYPEITFILKSAVALPNVTDDGRVIEDLPGGETKCALHGELVIHGHTAAVEGKGKCQDQGAKGWTVTGDAPVDMTAFGIAPPRLAFFTMDKMVTVNYMLVFRQR